MLSDAAKWRKSSHSGQSGSCVEVGLASDAVGVRDTKDRDGGTLLFDRRAWRSFLDSLRR
ncbi:MULTISPECIES: DUF397 domain-containing protein [unclassified Saccharopolyspora]|uniref:DUF397 domain-containing protein n=1 Tax=unclassified Saccharopolyspora TaxID=2646250 RepID=UPI001CD28755|nr:MULTISPECIES: DUF397 domain-containing protein [unclassified Saccharopolyspora]MCA1186454.1 DUF397 domain-containing protein [Saccharopolyspora sp. 6T]MCA1193569.1 DUF397 domain-containing protein [Saccharopolyspora sp. 6V]MCA1227557.1 DUF397 domain-containing protein [Saccharopolyspora sp. 6M]MCA1280066.1 DUF397 domain-containing protein [Saccharopolyspora sp. 7B]